MSTLVSSEQEDPFADLSALAASEFHHLVEQDLSLVTHWKSAILALLKEGIPDSLQPLDKLIEEETHAAPDNAYS